MLFSHFKAVIHFFFLDFFQRLVNVIRLSVTLNGFTLGHQRLATIGCHQVVDVILFIRYCERGNDDFSFQSVNVGGVAFPEDNLCVSLDNVYFTVEELNQRSFFIVDFQLCVNEQLFSALS